MLQKIHNDRYKLWQTYYFHFDAVPVLRHWHCDFWFRLKWNSKAIEKLVWESLEIMILKFCAAFVLSKNNWEAHLILESQNAFIILVVLHRTKIDTLSSCSRTLKWPHFLKPFSNPFFLSLAFHRFNAHSTSSLLSFPFSCHLTCYPPFCWTLTPSRIFDLSFGSF